RGGPRPEGSRHPRAVTLHIPRGDRPAVPLGSRHLPWRCHPHASGDSSCYSSGIAVSPVIRGAISYPQPICALTEDGPMALTAAELEKQKKQVEEMLAGPETLGFAKSLFFGRFKGDLLFPYPTLPADKREQAEAAVA